MPKILTGMTVGDRHVCGETELWRSKVIAHADGTIETKAYPVKVYRSLPVWWKYPWEEDVPLRWDKHLGEFVLDTNPAQKSARALEAAAAASARSAASRTRIQIRNRCHELGVNEMGTLTYRENMQDRDQAWRNWREFVRRMRRVWPDLAYVVVLERQKRGALHFHFATRDFPAFFEVGLCRVRSYAFALRVWRSVIGGGGSFHLRRGLNGDPLSIVTYISKYIGKTVGESESDKGRRQYAFAGIRQNPALVSVKDHEDQLACLVDCLTAHPQGRRVRETTNKAHAFKVMRSHPGARAQGARI